MTTDLEAVAYHEAGHAVMYVLYGIRFNYVTIEPDDKYLGRVHGQLKPWYRPDIDNSHYVNHHTEAQIIGFLAGPIAEGMFTDEDPVEMNVIVDGSDTDRATELALRMKGDGDAASEYLDELYKHAEEVVDTYWNLIEAVAKALPQRNYLRELEVYDLMVGTAMGTTELVAAAEAAQGDPTPS